MGNSLGAQLLKAGLVDKKQISRVNKEQYRKKKAQQGKEEAVPESKKLAQKAQLAQKVQAQQLNRERKQHDKQREIAAQIGQMIGASRVEINNGNLIYNFADNNTIKKIYVTKRVRDQLSRGQLAIVKHMDQYEVVPVDVAHKIAQRDAAAVLVLHEPKSSLAEDDPYAEFPIPDDLDW